MITFLAEYIDPIMHWLENHPYYALLAAFLISFVESLPFVGSIVPGSLTLTALGVLAGSGIMRIDLTFIVAILGAIAGDSLSYFIGLYYSDRLPSVWPFRKYPRWLDIGKKYFTCHGGKSVLIGRFIGPLRSIIPIIAGMMHMSRWRFFTANIVAAIVWSILYIFPGVLIGEASTTLSPENTTKLFILFLAFIIALWLASRLIRMVVRDKKHRILRYKINKILLIVMILIALILPFYLNRTWIYHTLGGLLVKI